MTNTLSHKSNLGLNTFRGVFVLWKSSIALFLFHVRLIIVVEIPYKNYMRTIKFRAWDKESKKILEWEKCGFGGNNLWLHWNTVMLEPEKYDVMQYTGLDDKNNKPIYEGDIVKGYGCYEDDYQETIGQVLYKEDQFCLCDKNGGAIEYFDSGEYSVYGLGVWKSNGDDEMFEVVGNVWQNPELLK